MFCCTLLYVHSSLAIILMGKRELGALLNLSSWCLVMDERLFLALLWGCLRFVIVVFPDHTHFLFLIHLVMYSWFTSQIHACFARMQTLFPVMGRLWEKYFYLKYTNDPSMAGMLRSFS